MQHMPELCNIAAYDLYEHTVITRGIVKPYDLRNSLQLFGNSVVQGAFFKIDANKSSDVITKLLKLNVQPGTFYNTAFLQLFDPYMNSPSGYRQVLAQVGIRDPSVIHHRRNYLQI